jgi:hypothetical protein
MSKRLTRVLAMLTDILLARAAAFAPVGVPVGTMTRAGAALLTAVLATLHIFLPVGLRRSFGLVSWLLPGFDAGDPLMEGLVDAPELGEAERVEGFDNAVSIHRGLVSVS